MHDPCFDGCEWKDEQLRRWPVPCVYGGQPCCPTMCVKLTQIKIKKSLLTLTRSYQWTDEMVYILAANKYLKYNNGRSRIIYIGTTKKGAHRPAASAVNKASEVFYKLHGVSKQSRFSLRRAAQ